MSNKAIEQSKQTNSLTKPEEFKVLPGMLVWLDTQIRMGTDVIDQIAKESKITDSTWYNWLKRPGFEDWYWSEYDKKIRRWKPLVDAEGIRWMKRGSPKHFEIMARRIGNIQDTNSSNVAVQVNNNTFTDDQLSRLAED